MSTSAKEPLKSGQGVSRVQLDLPTEKVEQLDRLAAEVGFATRKDLFNNALTLLQWAVKESRRGRAIASVDQANERFTELHMPFLSDLSHQAAQK
jgi:hypothetical protein